MVNIFIDDPNCFHSVLAHSLFAIAHNASFLGWFAFFGLFLFLGKVLVRYFLVASTNMSFDNADNEKDDKILNWLPIWPYVFYVRKTMCRMHVVGATAHTEHIIYDIEIRNEQAEMEKPEKPEANSSHSQKRIVFGESPNTIPLEHQTHIIGKVCQNTHQARENVNKMISAISVECNVPYYIRANLCVIWMLWMRNVVVWSILSLSLIQPEMARTFRKRTLSTMCTRFRFHCIGGCSDWMGEGHTEKDSFRVQHRPNTPTATQYWMHFIAMWMCRAWQCSHNRTTFNRYHIRIIKFYDATMQMFSLSHTHPHTPPRTPRLFDSFFMSLSTTIPLPL